MFRNLSSIRMVCGFQRQVVTARFWSFDGVNLKPLMLTETLRLSMQTPNLHMRKLGLSMGDLLTTMWQIGHLISEFLLCLQPLTTFPSLWFDFQPFCWTSQHKGLEIKWNFLLAAPVKYFAEEKKNNSKMKMRCRDFICLLFLISCCKKP